ncbi:MAG: hypothetical protein WA817_18025 [Candidatus Acidiferrum sp.]
MIQAFMLVPYGFAANSKIWVFRYGIAMGLEELTLRSVFLLFVGAATTIFFIMGGTALWEHKYLPGVFFLISGAALTCIFFERGRLQYSLLA